MYYADSSSSELDVAQGLFDLQSRSDSYYTEASDSDQQTFYIGRPSTQSSTSARAGSFDIAAEPDPAIVLLLRFRALPTELLMKVVDEVVREAVDSLYTGCRACRWQDWSHCICRHWQKAFCTLASLENNVGEHIRQFGKDLARSWGYSPVDAFGPYAAGFLFTGKVIGGLRMADFLFADEKLTALPEPEFEHVFVETAETASPPPPPPPKSESVYWISDKGKRLAGLDCTELTLNAEMALPAIKYTTKTITQKSKRASILSFNPFKPSAKVVVDMVSATASKLRGQTLIASSSGVSLLHARGSNKASASASFTSSHSQWASEKGSYI